MIGNSKDPKKRRKSIGFDRVLIDLEVEPKSQKSLGKPRETLGEILRRDR